MTLLAPRFATPEPGPDIEPAAAFLSRPRALERGILFLALFTYAWGTPIEWFAFAQDGEATSSAFTQLLFLGFLVNTVVALNGNWHVVLSAMKGEPLMGVFVVFITVSALWSTGPASTLQTGIVLMITYLTAMHLVTRFSVREMVQMFAAVFAAGALLNLGFVLAFEGAIDNVSFGTDGGIRSGWRGVTPSKNTLGRAALLGFLACIVTARVRRSWLVWPGFAFLNVLLLLGSNSATALGAWIGLCVLGVVLLGFRGRKTLYGATMVAMVGVFSTLTVLAATNLATLTGLLGKDTNFSGRLPIWSDAFEFGVSERPWLGFGWGGFWRHGVVDFDVQLRSNNFDIPHAHNALIDSWLALGPVGAVIFVLIFLRSLVWSTRHIRAVPTAIGLFPALTVSLAVIFSTTEAGFISRSIQFIMFVTAITVASHHKGVQRPFEERVRRGRKTIDPDIPEFAGR